MSFLKTSIDLGAVKNTLELIDKLNATHTSVDQAPIGLWIGYQLVHSDITGERQQEQPAHPASNGIYQAYTDFNYTARTMMSCIVVSAWAYIIEGCRYREVEQEAARRLLAPLWGSGISMDRLSQLFTDCSEAQSAVQYSLFDRSTGLQQSPVLDLEGKYYWWFAATGLLVLAQLSESPHPSQRDFSSHHVRIRGILDDMVQEWSDKWQPVLGIDRSQAQTLADRLNDYVTESTWLWNDLQQ